MMKKLLLAALLACALPMLARAQSYPTPTFNTLTLQNPLAVTSGGTGTTSLSGFATSGANSNITSLSGLTSPLSVGQGGTGGTTSTGSGAAVLATSPTLVTPNLGTPSAGVLTNATGLPLTTGITGTLSTANGGTGSANPAGIIYYLQSSDNTSGLQTAINAAENAGATLQLVGSGPISGTETVNAALKMVGQGQSVTTITASTTGTVFNITTGAQVTFSDFTIHNSITTGNSQVQIEVDPSGGENLKSSFSNLALWDAGTAMEFVAAAEWTANNIYIVEGTSSTYGFYVEDTYNADDGDSTIVNSTITSQGTVIPGYGIFQVSSGGLRVINNKINLISYPYVLDLAASTSDLLFEGNSVENFTGSGIVLERSTSSAVFRHAIITGNEFGYASITANLNYILVPIDASGVWLTGLTVNDNAFNMQSSGNNVAVNVNSTTGFTISNNVVISSAGTSLKTQTGSSASYGVVGPNIGVGTFSASSVSSTNTTNISPY